MFDWDNSDFWGSREANWDVAVCCGDLRSTQLLLDHEQLKWMHRFASSQLDSKYCTYRLIISSRG